VPAIVVLFSKDEELARSCRTMLNELFGAEWDLFVGSAGQPLPPHEVCIWDFVPGETPAPFGLDQEAARKNFFLLRWSEVDSLRELVGPREVHVLLKPMTRTSLRASLGKTGSADSPRLPGGLVLALKEDRDAMLQCLIEANLRLQENDQERTNFLARAIHDIRAPLTAICGYCGLLLEGDPGSFTPEHREIFERIQQSARRLTRTALSMSQLGVEPQLDGKLALENADIRSWVDRALNELAPFIEKKRLSVTVNIDSPPEQLLFEESQLEQALGSLLDNACKFTPREGSIEIRGYPYFLDSEAKRPGEAGLASGRAKPPNSYRIDIRDSGPGIPPGQLERIFEKSTSYLGPQDRSGAGLGLAFCRIIAQQHHGRVWAETSPDGAVFSFVLPFWRPETSAGKARSRAGAAGGGAPEE
jgi:signal transduction histidine kinase